MARPHFLYSAPLFLACLLISKAYGAPFPATSTSSLTAPERGVFFTPKGFRLGTGGTAWIPQEDGSLSKGDEGTSWRFSNSRAPQAQAHLKIDFLKAELSLEAYAKRWMKDYSQLGMDVLGSRPFALENTRGLVVDLVQPKKKLQLRQAVFLRKKSVVILTCSDTQVNFESTLSECNRLIKNFSWNEIPNGKVEP
jgi:hypothetical protein